MAEHIIGANAADVVHQHTSAEGSLTVTHNTRDFVANTVGHVLAVPFKHLPLWTWDAAFKNPPKELSTKLFERYKDVPWKGDVMVRVGHTSIMGDLQRLWASYDTVKGKSVFSTTHWTIDRAARALYTPIQIIKSSMAKVFRSDYYDPITNTAVVYHPNLAKGMHELGHAEFWDASKHREAWTTFYAFPIVQSFTEWKASANAMKRFKTDEERRQGLKVLEPMFASYLFSDVLRLVNIPGLPPLPTIAAPWIAGHFMARGYPRRAQRFEYVFSGREKSAKDASAGKKPDIQVPSKAVNVRPAEKMKMPELSAHQVLVATAKAPKPHETVGVEGKGGRQFSEDPLKQGKRPLHSNTSRITF